MSIWFFFWGASKFETCLHAEEKHADLLDFLSRAQAANMPVAYITTGCILLDGRTKRLKASKIQR